MNSGDQQQLYKSSQVMRNTIFASVSTEAFFIVLFAHILKHSYCGAMPLLGVWDLGIRVATEGVSGMRPGCHSTNRWFARQTFAGWLDVFISSGGCLYVHSRCCR